MFLCTNQEEMRMHQMDKFIPLTQGLESKLILFSNSIFTANSKQTLMNESVLSSQNWVNQELIKEVKKFTDYSLKNTLKEYKKVGNSLK